MELLQVQHVSVSVARSPQEVYRYAANIENLPRWAAGLTSGIRNVGGKWLVEGPLGQVEVRFTPPNQLGVLDHDVVFPSGETVHNPIRVVPNGSGSEVTFTLFRRPGLSDAEFAADRAAVSKDLDTLKGLLETASKEPTMSKADETHVHHGIDYIELTEGDIAAAKRFYGAAFGWRFNDYGPAYAGIQGQGSGPEVGGLRADKARTAPLVILYSRDLDATLANVREAGGKIVKEPYAFPGGRRFHFQDPSGNELAVWSAA